jgi:hypothetical protein
MEISFYLLLVIAHLGLFDVLYFHNYKCKLHLRSECQREVFWHVWRHLIYALQFFWVANLRFHGFALILLGVLYFFDIFVAWSDVWEENKSRTSQGGLPRGEYFMHVVLSLLVGAYLINTFQAVWADRNLATAIVYSPPDVPVILRIYMTTMGVIALFTFVGDLLKWLRFDEKTNINNSNKIVVEAIIPCDAELLWERTQTPDQHTLWDIRFSHIDYLEEKDEKGFHLMDYRTKIGFGIEVKGIGRYLQNNPPKLSTFEFESDDWKSIITIGRGIWQYKLCADGTYFRTVYDYEIRYGFFGEMLDSLLFRPVMQLGTEWGFETLRLWCEGDETALKRRDSNLKFIPFFIKRYLGFSPKKGEAISIIGNGQKNLIEANFQESLRVAT